MTHTGYQRRTSWSAIGPPNPAADACQSKRGATRQKRHLNYFSPERHYHFRVRKVNLRSSPSASDKWQVRAQPVSSQAAPLLKIVGDRPICGANGTVLLFQDGSGKKRSAPLRVASSLRRDVSDRERSGGRSSADEPSRRLQTLACFLQGSANIFAKPLTESAVRLNYFRRRRAAALHSQLGWLFVWLRAVAHRSVWNKLVGPSCRDVFEFQFQGVANSNFEVF